MIVLAVLVAASAFTGGFLIALALVDADWERSFGPIEQLGLPEGTRSPTFAHPPGDDPFVDPHLDAQLRAYESAIAALRQEGPPDD